MIKKLLSCIALIFVFSFNSKAQCPLTYYAGIGVANTGTTFATWANFGPGQYFAFPVLNGGSYAISTCGAPVSTQLTVYDGAASSVIALNTGGGPLCTGSNASIDNLIPNFTNYAYVQVTQYYCGPGGSSSINLYLRQNNNLVFTSSSAPMCSGQTRSLTATPANVGSTPGGYGNPGTFSGTGVSGNVFTAPVVSSITNYTITYTFGYVSQTQVITVNPNPTVTASSSPTLVCNGQQVTLNGGGASTYTWSGGITNGSPFTPTASGTYSVTGTSIAGCVSTNTATAIVNLNPAINTSTTIANVLCNGGSTGSATITTSGGTPGYTYLWSSAQTSSVISGLNAGVRTVTVTDANGCTKTNTVTITEPATGVTSSTVASNVLCNGASTGSATITASGGTPGYTYIWSTAATTSVATGLNAGVKTVTVTDANGCTTVNSVNITEPATGVTSSTVAANVLCKGGSTGSATVTASGGTPGYTYIWSTAATSSVITGLNAGVYTSTVTDANGCKAVNTVNVSEPATSVASATAATNVLCNGGSTGSATVTASGGTPGYTYIWSTSATTSVVTGLIAGIKTVTVTDANGCSVASNVPVTEPTAVASATATSDVLCNGGSTGSATVTASGGTPGYTYIWSTAATSSVVTGLNAGVYTSTVTDANGCTTINSVNITEPTAVVSATTTSDVLCNGGSNGSATVTASGGTPGYTYIWSTAATSSVITGLNAGVYTSTVTDANGCTTVKSVNITEPAALTASVVSVSSPGCSLTNGSITINATGGTGTLTYSWSPSGGTGSTESGLGVGSYTCLVTDVNSCTTTVSQSLSNPSSPTITPATTDAGCAGQTNGAITLTVTGGGPGYTYVWSPAVSSGSTATGLGAGIYNATVTDANNCTTSQSFTLTSFALPTVSANSSASVICGPPYQGSVTLGATGANTYTWSTSAIGNSVVVSPSVTTTYTVTGTDGNGCENSAVITQSVDACTGVQQLAVENSGFEVFPNPNNGKFSLRVSEKGTYYIINALGQTIRTIEMKEESQTVQIDSLSEGIYYVIGKKGKTKIVVSN